MIEIDGPGTLEKSILSAAFGGQIQLIGALADTYSPMDPAIFAKDIVSAHRAAVGSRADFKPMNRAISAHRLKPVIDRVFPFSEAREAFRHFRSRAHFGKLVIRHEG